MYYAYNKPEEIANAAFLCCAYAVLYQGQKPKEVISNPQSPRSKPSNLDPESVRKTKASNRQNLNLTLPGCEVL